jgi:hypothetical protein
MATLNKALTRPAAIMGIPLVPFVLVSGAIVLLAVYVSYYLAIMLIPAWAEMKIKPERTFIISVCSGWRLKPVGGFSPIPILARMPCWQTSTITLMSRSLFRK